MFYKLNLTAVSGTFSKVQPIIEAHFYNAEETEIAPKVRIAHNQTSHIFKNGEWYALKPVVVDVPKGTYKIHLIYILSLRDSANAGIQCSGNIYVDGIIID